MYDEASQQQVDGGGGSSKVELRQIEGEGECGPRGKQCDAHIADDRTDNSFQSSPPVTREQVVLAGIGPVDHDFSFVGFPAFRT
jgi:hypothetical protein